MGIWFKSGRKKAERQNIEKLAGGGDWKDKNIKGNNDYRSEHDAKTLLVCRAKNHNLPYKAHK